MYNKSKTRLLKPLLLLMLMVFAVVSISACKAKTISIKKDEDKANTVSSDAVSSEAAFSSTDAAINTDNSANSNTKESDTDSNTKNQNNSEQTDSSLSQNSLNTHGKLSVSGNTLVDSNNNPVQLHGVSTHGLAWFPDYVNKAAFQTMRDDWNVDTIRLALYTAEYNGYCTGGDKAALKQLIKNGVTYASELGMYAIIDWHILSDGNPNTYITESKSFWQEMASLYKDSDNVIFEICNEPNGSVSWNDVKNYATSILSIIRGAGANNIVLIGTPTWSQDIHLAANDPVSGYDNIMYTFHFYAATHTTDLQDRLSKAVSNGLPVFVSEFGICDASGNGTIDTDSANNWMSLLNKYNISTVCWNLSNKNEASAIINAGCDKKSQWAYSDLSAEGQWLVDTYKGSLKSKQQSSVTQNTTDNNVTDTVTQNTTDNNTTDTVTNNNDNIQFSSNNNRTGSGKVSVKCNQISSWNDGSSDYYQYEIIVTNTGNGTLNGWTTTVNFSENVEMNQFWCCNAITDHSKVTLTNLDYNMTLEAGASCNIGFIVKGSPTLKINSTN